jgi:hypothetical protein
MFDAFSFCTWARRIVTLQGRQLVEPDDLALLKSCAKRCGVPVEDCKALCIVCGAIGCHPGFAPVYPPDPQFDVGETHSAIGLETPLARVFLISTVTATTTIFIHPLKQVTVAVRKSSSGSAVRRRKSSNGIQREEV